MSPRPRLPSCAATHQVRHSPAPRTLAPLLLRAESVASSRIEGLIVGGRRLLRADAARRLGNDARDRTAEEGLAAGSQLLLAISGVAGGTPSTNNSLNGAFTKSGAPRISETNSPSSST